MAPPLSASVPPPVSFFLHAFRHICWPASCLSILRFWSSGVVRLARMQRLYLPEKAYKSLFLNSPNFQGTINRWNALPDLSWFTSSTQVPRGRESYTLCSSFPSLHWRRGKGCKSWFYTQGNACTLLCRTWYFTFISQVQPLNSSNLNGKVVSTGESLFSSAFLVCFAH